MSRKSQKADVRDSLADGLHAVAIRMLRSLRREDIASGIGPARLSVLSVLVFGEASTVSELADAEQVKLPTMSRLVAGLERDGLARRSPDDQDRRAVRVRPTEKGKRVLERARKRRLATLARRLESLSVREATVVREAEQILRRLFDERV
jgi:DNA-binding MarR family transcriptional regulator